MTYQQTLDFLFSQLPMYQRVGKAAYKADLNNTLALDTYFGNPHRKFRTIHVAGTNGKGSVSHMLASVLMEAGYKVGLYTSPHLIDFRERIRINGEMVSERFVVDFVHDNKKIIEEIKPSFFEMTVAMAFDFFAKQKVDVAVVEVGMGGRLDSTNIITPELSVITNISLDHTDFLGDTIGKIAAEKAGIIKNGIPVVVSQTQAETEHVFIETAKEAGAPIVFADKVRRIFETSFSSDGKKVFQIEKIGTGLVEEFTLDLLGSYQQKNIVGALAAIDVLCEKGYSILGENIKSGLSKTSANTGLLGRWQKLSELPLTICDTGHNTDGISSIVEQISSTSFEKLHMIIGFVNDKNIDGILQLLPKNADYYFTKASIPRAMDEKLLAQRAKMYGLKGESFENVKSAIDFCKTKSNPNDLIFIGGSTFVVADALK